MTAIVQFQRKEDAKFICSACGADRGCQCSAPAVEKLAQKQEQIRRASKAYRERKSEENQQPRHMTEAVVDDEEDDIEADVEPGIINREDLYKNVNLMIVSEIAVLLTEKAELAKKALTRSMMDQLEERDGREKVRMLVRYMMDNIPDKQSMKEAAE